MTDTQLPSHEQVRTALRLVNGSNITSMKDLLDLIASETNLDMRRAFRYMSLEGMEFADVDLTGYDFSYCNLDGADFRDALNWENARFTNAFGEAFFPDGLTTALALERVKALRGIDELIEQALLPYDDAALNDASRGPTLYGFLETMADHVERLADQSHDPAKARKVAREAIQSLSLTRQQVARIFQHLPTLSDFQMDELLKVFSDERQKFCELSQHHSSDVVSLALARSGPNRNFFQTLSIAYFPEGPAHRVAGQLLRLPSEGEIGDLFAAAADGLADSTVVHVPELEQSRLLSQVASALKRTDERFIDLVPILEEGAITASVSNSSRLQKEIRTERARAKLDDLSQIFIELANLPGTRRVADIYIDLTETLLAHRLLDAADYARQAFADRIEATQGFDSELYPLITLQQAGLTAWSLGLRGEYASALSMLRPHLSAIATSDSYALARIKAVLASHQAHCLIHTDCAAEAVAVMDQTCRALQSRLAPNDVLQRIRRDRVEALLLAGETNRARREAMDLSDPKQQGSTSSIIMPFLAWVAGADKRWLRRAFEAAAIRSARKSIVWDFKELGIIIPRLPPTRRATAQAMLRFLRGRLSVAAMKRHF